MWYNMLYVNLYYFIVKELQGRGFNKINSKSFRDGNFSLNNIGFYELDY
jgi:hypothetical protein